jgi:hypothetical protein
VLDGKGSILGRVKTLVFYLQRLDRSRPALRARPTSYRMGMGGGISPGVKRPASEGDHLPQFSAKFMNSGTIPSFPHMSSWRSA